ncbi:MAG: hypothetical protein IPK75_19790 [Acidobacteria bacterium]|nr:hypothetical protein [Acidobacteriota bacterium]
MLDELCQLLRNNNPRVDLVLFIDEADQIRDRTGFGQLVKRIDTAKIVIVGIGDTIDNLISDHASSGRKLIGGLIELETLEEKEIEKIFRDAEEKSNGMLSFTNSFIQKAKRLSAGFPWVAQNLGYQALTRELLNRDVDAAGPVKLGMEAFRYAVDEVRSVYVNDIDKKVRFEELNTPEAALLVSIIANAPRGRPLTDKEISQELLKQGHRMSMVDIDLYLGRLEDDANLLVKRTDLRYRFRDPIARTFALDRIDQVRGETVDDTE